MNFVPILIVGLIIVGICFYYYYKKYNTLYWEDLALQREKRQMDEENGTLRKENSSLWLFKMVVLEGYRIAQPGNSKWLIKQEQKEGTIYIHLQEVDEIIRDIGSLRIWAKENHCILESFWAIRKEVAVILFSQLLLLKEKKGAIEVDESRIKVGYLEQFLEAGGDKLLAGVDGVSKQQVIAEFKKKVKY